MRLNDEFITLTVSGVYRDFPSTSTINPDFIADLDLTGAIFGEQQKVFGQYANENEDYKNWDNFSFSTYLRLNPRASASEVAQSMSKFRELSENENRRQWAYSLQRVTDIYLRSNELEGNQFVRQGNAKESGYYAGIAALILIIALFNYIFLTRAKMMRRLRELGAKKAIGASGHSIRRQIIFESNVISLLSLIPALVVIFAGIPFLNDTLGCTLDTKVFSMWYTGPLLLLTALITGVLSGLVIGFNIARTSAVLLLSGNSSRMSSASRFGNSFLSVHFILFMVLVSGVLLLKKQINYAMTDFKAIDPKNVIIAELNSSERRAHFATIKDEMDKHPGVLKSAGSSFIPPFNNVLPLKLDNQGEKIQFDGLIMGEGMTELLGMEFIDGESFGSFEAGRVNVIFNESAAHEYKLKAGEFFNGFFVKGVVKDFNVHSLRALIRPMAIIQQDPSQMSLFAMKTDGKDDEALAATVKKLFKEISPDQRVHVYSLTDQIALFYEKEQTSAEAYWGLLAVGGRPVGYWLVRDNAGFRFGKGQGDRHPQKLMAPEFGKILALLNAGFLKWVAVAFVPGHPDSLVRHAQMVGILCLQNGIKLVDLCPGRSAGVVHRTHHGKLAKLESRHEKPGRILEV